MISLYLFGCFVVGDALQELLDGVVLRDPAVEQADLKEIRNH